MSMSKFNLEMESYGHTVVESKKCVVIDHGGKRFGVDESGKIYVNPDVDINNNAIRHVVYIPKEKSCEVYYGDTVTATQIKIDASSPDIVKEETNGKTIEVSI